jgi:hypothetical protein
VYRKAFAWFLILLLVLDQVHDLRAALPFRLAPTSEGRDGPFEPAAASAVDDHYLPVSHLNRQPSRRNLSPLISAPPLALVAPTGPTLTATVASALRAPRPTSLRNFDVMLC